MKILSLIFEFTLKAVILCLALFGLIILLAASSDVEASTCRNSKIKHSFDLANGFPHGRKGYVVDHIAPLVCGGKDTTSNMPYLTLEEGKLKDRWETTPTGCKILCKVTECTPTRQVFNCN